MSFHDESQSDPFAILQQFLDIISDQPGAIIYRDHDGWRALIPETPGSILTIGPDLLPFWDLPT